MAEDRSESKRPRPLQGHRLLVVDDQDSIRELLERALGEAGAEVWSASDGRAALDVIGAASPEVILLDLAMPGLQGWDVIDVLRQSPATAGIPIVLQTSAEDFASFDRARQHGVAAVISKPFRLAEVVETCRRILHGARPLQGRGVTEEEGTEPVQVHDDQGVLLERGLLLDLDKAGAQVELERPLRIAQRVTLTSMSGRSLAERAEVRWVTHVGNRYQHGLAVRKD